MKIIKSIPVLLVCICTTILLHAQDTKTEIAKPVEVKIQAVANNAPSPQPALIPQPQVAATPTNAPAAAAETPSPLTRKEDAKPAVKEKTEVKIASDKDVITPGGEEGRKIMAGKASKPNEPVYSPSTIDTKPAPQVTRSAGSNQQQQ
jgi:hypothetical protein